MRGSVQFVLPIPNSVGVTQMKEAAKYAAKCVSIVRDWLPVTGEPVVSEPLDQDRWQQLAFEMAVSFFEFHSTPGCTSSVGPPISHAAWGELCRGMVVLRDHYGWQNVRKDSLMVPFSLSHPPVEPSVLDRIERATRYVFSLEETAEDRKLYSFQPRGDGLTSAATGLTEKKPKISRRSEATSKRNRDRKRETNRDEILAQLKLAKSNGEKRKTHIMEAAAGTFGRRRGWMDAQIKLHGIKPDEWLF